MKIAMLKEWSSQCQRKEVCNDFNVEGMKFAMLKNEVSKCKELTFLQNRRQKIFLMLKEWSFRW